MKQFTLLVLVVLCLSSCDSTSSGPNTLSGDLTGRVELYDSQGMMILDKSGVAVTIEGTDKTVLTDNTGKWTITGLPAGTYVITFTKAGYGEEKLFGQQFVGGGVAFLGSADLAQAPTSVIFFNKFYISPDRAHVGISGNLPHRDQSVIVCLSRDSAKLLANPSQAELTLFTHADSYDTTGYFGQGVGIYDFAAREFFDTISTGTILFAALRIVGVRENYSKYSSYYDPSLNRWIYTAPGPISQILKDTVP